MLYISLLHCFHLLQIPEFQPKPGVLRIFILGHITVLPKMKGVSGLVSGVSLCSYIKPSINQVRYEEPQLVCATKTHVKSWKPSCISNPPWMCHYQSLSMLDVLDMATCAEVTLITSGEKMLLKKTSGEKVAFNLSRTMTSFSYTASVESNVCLLHFLPNCEPTTIIKAITPAVNLPKLWTSSCLGWDQEHVSVPSDSQNLICDTFLIYFF